MSIEAKQLLSEALGVLINGTQSNDEITDLVQRAQAIGVTESEIVVDDFDPYTDPETRAMLSRAGQQVHGRR